MLGGACTKKAIPIPESVLTRQELVPVLVDMHLAQTLVTMNLLADSTRYKLNAYEVVILNKHHVTKEKYDSSMSFYAANPELLDEIYQDVINELSKKQGEASAKK